MDLDVHNVPAVVSACCVLHNVCETHGDYFDDEWVASHTASSSPSSVRGFGQVDDNGNAKNVRQALCTWLSANPI